MTRFDEKAQFLDAHPVMRELADHFSCQVEKVLRITSVSHILDYGCGSGLVVMRLSRYAEVFVAADTSMAMLNILKSKITQDRVANIHIACSEIFGISARSEIFDLMYLNNVLHHISDLYGFLRAAHELLRPKGFLCVGDLCAEDGSFHEYATDARHNGFSEDVLSRILKSAGFKHVEWYQYYTIKKKVVSGKTREYPVFFMRAQK